MPAEPRQSSHANINLLDIGSDLLLTKLWPRGRFLIGHRVSKYLHTLFKKVTSWQLIFVRPVESIPLAKAWIKSLEGRVELSFPEYSYMMRRGAHLHAIRISLDVLEEIDFGMQWRGPALLSLKDCHIGDELFDTGVPLQLAYSLSIGNAALSSLTHIDLSGNRLGSKFLKPVLEKLHTTAPSIIHLSLASNILGYNSGNSDLMECCFSLRTLTALQELVVSRNVLRNPGASALGLGLALCTSLKSLDCAYNDMDSEGLGHVCRGLMEGLSHADGGMTFLDISGNAVGAKGAQHVLELATAGLFLPSCELRLGQTFMGSEPGGSENIAMALSYINSTKNPRCNLSDHSSEAQNLRALELSHENFGEDGGILLCKVVSECTNLQQLNFPSGVRLGRGGSQLLATSISNCTILTELTLSGLVLGKRGCENLGSSLRMLQLLETLKLDGTGMTDDGCAHVANALGASCRRLSCLHMGEDDLSDASGEHLRQALRTCSQLTDLSVGKNPKMSMYTARSLAALSSALDLVRLDINGCSFGARGTHALLTFCSRGNLQYLNMSDVTARDSWDGALELSQALAAPCMANLTFLDVSSNSICLETFSDALGQFKYLQSLNMSGVAAGNGQGMLQVARALSACSALSHLVAGNNFCGSTDTVACMTYIMRNCRSLTELCIEDNGLGYHGAIEIAKCVAEGCLEGLIKLDLSENQMTEPGAEAVAAELCR
jgi:Ran GTPase-activating protein (RanGAP) involved in mRNA processing and transport